MINRTFRLFVSSTFSDFILERNILNKEIYPQLRDYCRARGYDFQLIDLRWGINGESSINQNTLDICLSEVQRCKDTELRPSFLAMLGERYGWIPLPSRIEERIFVQIMNRANQYQKKLLSYWFFQDKNDIDNVYVLMKRCGKYVDDNIWGIEEKKIQATLIELSKKANCDKKFIDEISTSATEHEIVEGMLNEETIGHVMVVFREGYFDRDDNLDAIIQLRNKVKKRIDDELDDNDYIEIQWDNNYEEVFKIQVLDNIKTHIAKEIDRCERVREKTDKNVYEKLIPEHYFANKTSDVCISQLLSFIDTFARVPIFLYGESGCGKTTLLARLLRLLEEDKSYQNLRSIYRFYGLGEDAYSLTSSLKGIIDELRNYCNLTFGRVIDKANVVEMFQDTIKHVPNNKRVLIVIDGIDVMSDIMEFNETLLPNGLPSNVAVIVSFADASVARRIGFNNDYSKTVCISMYSSEESYSAVMSAVNYYRRNISDENQERIIINSVKNGATPLQIKVITDICKKWRSFDKPNILKSDTKSVVLRYISDLYEVNGHNKEFVLYTLALIAASPNGIMENEIQEYVFAFEEIKKYFVMEDRYSHDLFILPYVIWSRLFSDMKDCLSLTIRNGLIVVSFCHKIFYDVFIDNFPRYFVMARDVLLKTYMKQSNYIGKYAEPNKQKMLSVIPILKQMGEMDEIAELYSDYSFVDCMVKTRQTDKALRDISSLIVNNNKFNNEQLRISYKCLFKHQMMLNCYYDSFIASMDMEGIDVVTLFGDILSPKFRFIKPYESSIDEFVPFLYSVNSKIYLDLYGRYYIVTSMHNIYLCDFETYLEIARIYIGDEEATNVEWLGDNRFAVKTNCEKISVFTIQDGMIRKDIDIACDNINHCMKYVVKENILLYVSNEGLNAVELCDGLIGTRRYYVSLGKKKDIGFDIDSTSNEIIYKDCASIITIRDAHDGGLIKEIEIHESSLHDFIDELVNGSSIKRICTGEYFLWRKDRSKLEIICGNGKVRFLNPPMKADADDIILVCNRYCFIASKTKVCCISFEDDYCIRNIELSYLNSIFWCESKQMLFVLLDRGLQQICVPDLFEVDKNDERCMVSRFNLRYDFLAVISYTLNYFKSIRLSVYSFINNYRKNGKGDFRYEYYFKALETTLSGEAATRSFPKITQCIFAKDGKVALVCEEKGTITIKDQEGSQLMYIDRLNLSVDNNILSAQFDYSSECFLVWRNYSIEVYSVSKCKKIFDISLFNRPAADVFFSKNNELCVKLFDNNIYGYRITPQEVKALRALPKIIDEYDNTCDLYCPIETDEGLKAMYLLQELDESINPSKWFRHVHFYQIEDGNLVYLDDELFFIDKDGCEHIIAANNVNITKSHEDEMIRDTSFLSGYLREKKSLHAKIYKCHERNVKSIIVVLEFINSILLIDMERYEIMEAIKLDGNILGSRITERGHIEIVVDVFPYRRVLA